MSVKGRYGVHSSVSCHIHFVVSGAHLRIEPLGLGFNCHQIIVKVHDTMNSIVHHTKNDPHWLGLSPAVPAKDKNSNVMVPMQKEQLLFVYHNEESVNELNKFA